MQMKPNILKHHTETVLRSPHSIHTEESKTLTDSLDTGTRFKKSFPLQMVQMIRFALRFIYKYSLLTVCMWLVLKKKEKLFYGFFVNLILRLIMCFNKNN